MVSASQTKLLWSTKMPCPSLPHLSSGPSPPQPCTTLPAWSNSITGGAGTQQITFVAVDARFSRASSELGRWLIQIWSCASTVMPPMVPMIQLLGSVCGQFGSTWNRGTFCAATSAGVETAMAAASSAVCPMCIIAFSDVEAERRTQKSGGYLCSRRPIGVLHGLDAVVLERERANALAGRRKVRIEDRRRRHCDRGFADAAPESA